MLTPPPAGSSRPTQPQARRRERPSGPSRSRPPVDHASAVRRGAPWHAAVRRSAPTPDSSSWRWRLPVIEALILGMIGAAGAQALAPQASAPAPFGVFHDLRWLLVFHPSWHAFALELAALIAVRSTITALLLRAAWPIGKDPPVRCGSPPAPWRSPWSPPWCSSLRRAAPRHGHRVAVVVVLHRRAVGARRGSPPPPRCRGADVVAGAPAGPHGRGVLLSFLVLTMASAVVVLMPKPLRLPAVGAAGLFNAWAWHSIVHTLSCARRPGGSCPWHRSGWPPWSGHRPGRERRVLRFLAGHPAGAGGAGDPPPSYAAAGTGSG